MNLQQFIDAEREVFIKQFGSIHEDRPMPSGLETAKNIQDFLTASHHRLIAKVREMVERDISYIRYNLRNAIRNERDGLHVKGHENDVERWLAELKAFGTDTFKSSDNTKT